MRVTNTSDNAERSSDDGSDTPADILSMTATEHNIGRIDSGYIRGRWHDQDVDAEFGVQIHQDGPGIALSTGTLWSPDDSPNLDVYQGLTVEQAAEIRDALDEAIQNAEASQEDTVEESKLERFVKKLLGGESA